MRTLPTFLTKKLIKKLYDGIVQVEGFLGVWELRMGILDFWKKEEEQTPQLPTAEQLEEQKKKELEKQNKKDLEDRLENLDRFPGSLSEYIALKREEGLDYSEIVVPMSTGRRDKYVLDISHSKGCAEKWVSRERKILYQLISQGGIGLIGWNRNDTWIGNDFARICYGIPVKIKKQPSYR